MLRKREKSRRFRWRATAPAGSAADNAAWKMVRACLRRIRLLIGLEDGSESLRPRWPDRHFQWERARPRGYRPRVAHGTARRTDGDRAPAAGAKPAPPGSAPTRRGNPA